MSRLSIDLEAIKARAEAATPEPWVWEIFSSAYGGEWVVFDLTDRVVASCSGGWGPDARFIGSAREDVPALVAEIERLTGEPTEDEIERAARGLWEAWGASWSITPWRDLDDEDRADMLKDARVALRAARGLS